MNVNIYYGGRGLVDDPTIVVINRIQEVLEELNVHVTRYNLYEIKNTICDRRIRQAIDNARRR